MNNISNKEIDEELLKAYKAFPNTKVELSVRSIVRLIKLVIEHKI
jgi:hypothetical protein